MEISIVIPFYKGNQYLSRLFRSIEKVVEFTKDISKYEIILVNDSPTVEIELPDNTLNVKIIINKQNLGIQGARINGLRHASGEWVLFLDQDDELIADGFHEQIKSTQNTDVVVGNGIYILGNVNKIIYLNQGTMEYLIQEKRFIEIRNLIPSPGECLIKITSIPELWKENELVHNGADDWFLWLLLFKSGAKFTCNNKLVYIHNDTRGNNLSANLSKMRESSLEMLNILENNDILQKKEANILEHSINFKYYQDTKQLTVGRLIKYANALFSNIKYRFILNVYKWKRE